MPATSQLVRRPRGTTGLTKALMDYLMQRYGPIIKDFAKIYPDNEPLHAQLRAVSVTGEDWDINRAGGHLKLEVPMTTAAVDLDIIDARTTDADGALIGIILHFVDGRLNWGEWYRMDGEPIRSWPPDRRS